MFTDLVKLHLVGGRGGDGAVKFARSKKPSGGDGGDGGSVVLVANPHKFGLTHLAHVTKLTAEAGKPGDVEKSQGKSGQDLEIPVPIATNVYDLDGKRIARLEKAGDRFIAAAGGRGGLGNFYFRAGQVNTLRKFTHGRPGTETSVQLELEIQADAVLIGLPNTGKSSLLNFLTNSKSRVGGYPFTTLTPHPGKSEDFTILDLPGLIRGTAQGKGLGGDFIRHTRSAKLVVHVLSLENQHLQEDYETIRAELSELDDSLAAKPELLVFSKADVLTPELEKLAQNFAKKQKLPYKFVSILQPETGERLLAEIKKLSRVAA